MRHPAGGAAGGFGRGGAAGGRRDVTGGERVRGRGGAERRPRGCPPGGRGGRPVPGCRVARRAFAATTGARCSGHRSARAAGDDRPPRSPRLGRASRCDPGAAHRGGGGRCARAVPAAAAIARAGRSRVSGAVHPVPRRDWARRWSQVQAADGPTPGRSRGHRGACRGLARGHVPQDRDRRSRHRHARIRRGAVTRGSLGAHHVHRDAARRSGDGRRGRGVVRGAVRLLPWRHRAGRRPARCYDVGAAAGAR